MHADATTPTGPVGASVASSPHGDGLPCEVVKSAPASYDLSRPARRSLTFRPACSLKHPRRFVSSEASTDSLPPPSPRLLPAGATRRRVGLSPTGNRRLRTAHDSIIITNGRQPEDPTPPPSAAFTEHGQERPGLLSTLYRHSNVAIRLTMSDSTVSTRNNSHVFLSSEPESALRWDSRERQVNRPAASDPTGIQ
jgi:hypothetical protein